MKNKALTTTMMTAVMIAGATASLLSCSEPPVIELEQPNDMKENLLNANRYIAESERTQIDGYIARRGWKTQRLNNGSELYVIRQGKGRAIDYEDTVHVRYQLSTLTGTVIYEKQEDDFVIGHCETTAGLEAAAMKLRYGSEAWLIVPSEAGYGVVGDGDRVPTRTVLVYHLIIADKKSKHQYVKQH